MAGGRGAEYAKPISSLAQLLDAYRSVHSKLGRNDAGAVFLLIRATQAAASQAASLSSASESGRALRGLHCIASGAQEPVMQIGVSGGCRS